AEAAGVATSDADRSLVYGSQSGGPAVIDLTTGAELLALDFAPLRWAGADRLYGAGQIKFAVNAKELVKFPARQAVGEMTGGVCVGAFDRAASQSKAAAGRAAFAPAHPNVADRPPVAEADRSAAARAKPAPPAAWTAPAVKPVA